MNSQIYFRYDQNTKEEFEICSKYFKTVSQRTELDNQIKNVICRYSALPFNKELENDLKNIGCKPINSSIEHSYIADMGWIYDLEDLTFPTWTTLSDVPDNTPIILKGKTNSRKFEWNTKMFAKNKQEAINIMHELWHDPLIGPQGLVFRKYIPLLTYEVGINGLPMTNEWRCFFYKNKLIDFGYYWSTLNDMSVINQSEFEKEGLIIAKKAAEIICENTNFFVLDIAQDINNKWWIVEVNDGQMSGLSTIPIQRFYKNLYEILKE